MENTIEEPISIEEQSKLVEKIKENKWWQGSLISSSSLQEYLQEQQAIDHDWWIITTQTCNIYNYSFENVPIIEILAAKKIDTCNARYIKGDDPRILHLMAVSSNDDAPISLELSIQSRKWISRELLAKLPTPIFNVRNIVSPIGTHAKNNQYLETFVSWIARSYTRVTLPDDFNNALRSSKIEQVLKEKLTRHKDELYGIYLKIDRDAEQIWDGLLGEMPPPYLLEIILVVYDNVDPETLKDKLISHVFEPTIDDPDNKTNKIARSEIAMRNKIRINQRSIYAKTMSGTICYSPLSRPKYK